MEDRNMACPSHFLPLCVRHLSVSLFVVAKVELFEDGAVVETGKAAEWTITRSPAAGQHYWFVKITQADGDLLWSAPVWVSVATE